MSDVRPTPGRLLPYLAVDVAVAALVAAIAVIPTHFAADHQDRGPLGAAGLVLLLGGAAALTGRRRYPVGVLAITFVTTLAYWSLGYPRGPVWGSLIVAFATAILTGHRRAAVTSLALGFIAFPWLGAVIGREPAPSWQAILALAAWLGVLLSVFELARSRRDRARETARSLAAETRTRASEERVRIARELHDVVAHNISLINVQAGVALHLMEERPEQARVALAAIKQSSKEALVELRSVLGVLRDVDDGAPLGPTTGLARLPVLVERARAAGLTIHVEHVGAARALPTGVDLAAFRIVQEAITNVTRHAGCDQATVRIECADHELRVDVLDEGAGVARTADGSRGNGIAGMRERALALGGELVAEPRPGRGFAVRARLPIEGAP